MLLDAPGMRLGMITRGMVLSFILGILFAAVVVRFAYHAADQRKAFLARVTEAEPVKPRTEANRTEASTLHKPVSGVERSLDQPDPNHVLGIYEGLAEENPDFIGWIKIPDTEVDYPVMHTPSEPEKYLQLSFTQEHNQNGVPFVDHRCSVHPDSDNLIIYGHNMKSGKMFASIVNYKMESYYREHPLIEFDSLYEKRKYRVLAAFYDRVYYEDEDVFKFYNFINARNEKEYEDAVRAFKEKSIYDTGVEAQYGDHLITLVTCTYQVDNGRFVVIAKQEE